MKITTTGPGTIPKALERLNKGEVTEVRIPLPSPKEVAEFDELFARRHPNGIANLTESSVKWGLHFENESDARPVMELLNDLRIGFDENLGRDVKRGAVGGFAGASVLAAALPALRAKASSNPYVGLAYLCLGGMALGIGASMAQSLRVRVVEQEARINLGTPASTRHRT